MVTKSVSSGELRLLPLGSLFRRSAIREIIGTSLAVQWLRPFAPNAGSWGSIAGQETNLDPTCCNKDLVQPNKYILKKKKKAKDVKSLVTFLQ